MKRIALLNLTPRAADPVAPGWITAIASLSRMDAKSRCLMPAQEPLHRHHRTGAAPISLPSGNGENLRQPNAMREQGFPSANMEDAD